MLYRVDDPTIGEHEAADVDVQEQPVFCGCACAQITSFCTYFIAADCESATAGSGAAITNPISRHSRQVDRGHLIGSCAGRVMPNNPFRQLLQPNRLCNFDECC